jgi:hypothetical protein
MLEAQEGGAVLLRFLPIRRADDHARHRQVEQWRCGQFVGRGGEEDAGNDSGLGMLKESGVTGGGDRAVGEVVDAGGQAGAAILSLSLALQVNPQAVPRAIFGQAGEDHSERRALRRAFGDAAPMPSFSDDVAELHQAVDGMLESHRGGAQIALQRLVGWQTAARRETAISDALADEPFDVLTRAAHAGR